MRRSKTVPVMFQTPDFIAQAWGLRLSSLLPQECKVDMPAEWNLAVGGRLARLSATPQATVDAAIEAFAKDVLSLGSSPGSLLVGFIVIRNECRDDILHAVTHRREKSMNRSGELRPPGVSCCSPPEK